MSVDVHSPRKAKRLKSAGDDRDALVPARGIAHGVIGGAIVWAVLLISSIGLLKL
jgi:hypothetical protein